MALVATRTYEEGSNGQPLASGNGIDQVANVNGGTSTYSTTAAIHGNLGVAINNTGNSQLYYPVAYPYTGSVYIRRGLETPTNRIEIISFATSTSWGGIGIKKTGEWFIEDSSQTFQAASVIQTAPGDKFRCDWQLNYSSTTIQVTAKFFRGANSEGSVADATLTANLSSATAPDHVRFQSSSGASLSLDTFRLWNDTAAWPAPYAPAPSVTVWNGTQEVAVASVTVWNGTQEVAASLAM